MRQLTICLIRIAWTTQTMAASQPPLHLVRHYSPIRWITPNQQSDYAITTFHLTFDSRRLPPRPKRRRHCSNGTSRRLQRKCWPTPRSHRHGSKPLSLPFPSWNECNNNVMVFPGTFPTHLPQRFVAPLARQDHRSAPPRFVSMRPASMLSQTSDTVSQTPN